MSSREPERSWGVWALLTLLGGVLIAPTAGAVEGDMGDAVCAACHADRIEYYERTVHAKVFSEGNARTPLMQRGCEACHGSGGAHVAAGGGPMPEGMLHLRSDGSEEPEAQNEVCLQCHEGTERTYWHGSAHEAARVSCGSCHTVMKAESRQGLLSARSEAETCGRCHPVARSRQLRNAHMPVREGKMSCSSCHNPHGTIAESLIGEHTINQNCYRCHAEKRGPFLWEHAPVYEDCLHCHDPHGSTREAMLKVSLPRLCQQCHNSSGHPGSPRSSDHRFVIGKSCLNCHTNVHGSNHPSGRRFTR